jgi:hypothetical protein
LITVNIGQDLHVRAGKRAHRTEETKRKEVILLQEISTVIVAHLKEGGPCVRIITSEGGLYATSGRQAEKIITWATRIQELTIKEPIPPFPTNTSFKKVNGKVKIQGGEILVA